MKKSEALRLWKLVEEWTRAEVMSRLGPSIGLEFADYFKIAIEKGDEMRELVLGTSNQVELARRWGMIEEKKDIRRKKKKVKSDKPKNKKTKKNKEKLKKKKKQAKLI